MITLLLPFIFNLVGKKKPNNFLNKLMIPVDTKTKRFEECGHLRIAAASVSNIF